MKIQNNIALIAFTLVSHLLIGQSDSTKKYPGKDTLEYPSGLNISVGLMLTSNTYNYHYRSTYFFGNNRQAQAGFTFGFNSYNYLDTTNKASNYKLINSMGIGVAGKAYSPDGTAYITTSAMFLTATFDQRFGATTGMGLSAALGVTIKRNIFIELGLTGTSFLTRTLEKPSAWGAMLNLGVNL